MSLVTQMLVAEQYGIRLDIETLGKAVGMKPGSIHNAISAGSFPIATYVDVGKRWADYRDVAAHIDACRERAA